MKILKVMFLFFLMAVNLSGCLVKPNGGYVMFFYPRIKCEYCSNKETILEASEYLLKKVFHKKNFTDYNVISRECEDTLVLVYVRKDFNNERIMRFEVNEINDEIIKEMVNANIDTNKTPNYFVIASTEECNANIITILIEKDYVSTSGTITLRHDNICKIIISKKNCKIIDFIGGVP